MNDEAENGDPSMKITEMATIRREMGTWLFCFASTNSFTSAAAVVKRTLRFCRHAARHSPVAR